MKNTILAMAALAALAACSSPEPPASPVPAAEPKPASSMGQFDALEQAALDGDYQAQRNLAYTLGTGIPNNPILACAWRIVIVESGDPQVDQSDLGNKTFDCERKLDADGLAAAEAQAKQISELIVIRENRLMQVEAPGGASIPEAQGN